MVLERSSILQLGPSFGKLQHQYFFILTEPGKVQSLEFFHIVKIPSYSQNKPKNAVRQLSCDAVSDTKLSDTLGLIQKPDAERTAVVFDACRVRCISH